MSVNSEFSTLLKSIADDEDFQLKKSRRLSGGDINEVFLVETTTGENLVIKINSRNKFPGMFEAEKKGLERLAESGIFKIPKVVSAGEQNLYSYLIMEYIETGRPSANFSGEFGEKLAGLHKITSRVFGFECDNYIGSLPQKNDPEENAAKFYYKQRLLPQFSLAQNLGFDLGNTNFMDEVCDKLIPDEPPALVHGDLWSGNYLVTAKGAPCLIDPAVAFAPREMDLGMMKLFGGFDAEIFKTYEQNFPLEKDFEKRLPLWQLYYLLVHLNIFGAAYQSRVIAILDRYRNL